MKAHTHRCTTCLQDFECTGTLSPNHDGWPETVCSIRHDVFDPITECPSCYEAEKCAWCGEPGDLIDAGDGDRLHPACVEAALTQPPQPRSA